MGSSQAVASGAPWRVVPGSIPGVSNSPLPRPVGHERHRYLLAREAVIAVTAVVEFAASDVEVAAHAPQLSRVWYLYGREEERRVRRGFGEAPAPLPPLRVEVVHRLAPWTPEEE